MKNKIERLSALLVQEKISGFYQSLNNKRSIQIIQQVIDGRDLSYEDFIYTGVFIPVSSLTYKPNNLRANCTDIVKYVGPFFIQVLNNGDGKAEYVYEIFDNEEGDEMHTVLKSEDLKAIEKHLWDYEANNYFNL